MSSLNDGYMSIAVLSFASPCVRFDAQLKLFDVGAACGASSLRGFVRSDVVGRRRGGWWRLHDRGRTVLPKVAHDDGRRNAGLLNLGRNGAYVDVGIGECRANVHGLRFDASDGIGVGARENDRIGAQEARGIDELVTFGVVNFRPESLASLITSCPSITQAISRSVNASALASRKRSRGGETWKASSADACKIPSAHTTERKPRSRIPRTIASSMR